MCQSSLTYRPLNAVIVRQFFVVYYVGNFLHFFPFGYAPDHRLCNFLRHFIGLFFRFRTFNFQFFRILHYTSQFFVFLLLPTLDFSLSFSDLRLFFGVSIEFFSFRTTLHTFFFSFSPSGLFFTHFFFFRSLIFSFLFQILLNLTFNSFPICTIFRSLLLHNNRVFTFLMC